MLFVSFLQGAKRLVSKLSGFLLHEDMSENYPMVESKTESKRLKKEENVKS